MIQQAEDIQHFSYVTNKLTPILSRFEDSKEKARQTQVFVSSDAT